MLKLKYEVTAITDCLFNPSVEDILKESEEIIEVIHVFLTKIPHF